MTDFSDRTRENFETVYKISHAVEYGFGGDTTIWVAVLDETDDQIIGRRFGPMVEWPGDKIVINKENVAGWKEDTSQYQTIPEEVPRPSTEDVRRAYVEGRIDDAELEAKLRDAIHD